LDGGPAATGTMRGIGGTSTYVKENFRRISTKKMNLAPQSAKSEPGTKSRLTLTRRLTALAPSAIPLLPLHEFREDCVADLEAARRKAPSRRSRQPSVALA
jgi:hypothetical protein